MAHPCNPSALEAEAGAWWFQGQPGKYRKDLVSEKEKEKKSENKQNLGELMPT